MGSHEQLVYLLANLQTLKAFLYDVWWKFQLAQSYKVPCDFWKDLFIFFFRPHFQNILNQIISKRVFDQFLKIVYNHVC